MTYDEDLAQIFREDFARFDNVTEKKMFGGLCFLLNGNMLCGVHKDGGMARVGKENEPLALQIEGVSPLSFTGRKMGGLVDLDVEVINDYQKRADVMALAIEYVENLPPK